ncbi:MAG: UPF0193 protein EVG1 [Alphaproteobacteria bacterium]|nr:UPF0193 protein EVG1 [Alphaproteobacteria bacterium]
MATILHVALLSLHLTAAFERGIQAPGADGATLDIHAFCSPTSPGSAPPQSTFPVSSADGETAPGPNGEKSSPGCPICTGAAPASCSPAPSTVFAPVAFSVAFLPPYVTSDKARAHPERPADTIRGPPAVV